MSDTTLSDQERKFLAAGAEILRRHRPFQVAVMRMLDDGVIMNMLTRVPKEKLAIYEKMNPVVRRTSKQLAWLDRFLKLSNFGGHFDAMRERICMRNVEAMAQMYMASKEVLLLLGNQYDREKVMENYLLGQDEKMLAQNLGQMSELAKREGMDGISTLLDIRSLIAKRRIENLDGNEPG